jgi:hypothetical protein
MPFLLQAARLGRANIVDRFARHYGCDVNCQRRHKDRGTALHLAAYFGFADVVDTLLKLYSNHTIKNKFGETALDSAKAGKKAYETDKKKFILKTTDIELLLEIGLEKGFQIPSTCSTRVDLTTRKGWPGWDDIIHNLEKKSVDKTQ